MMKRPMYSFLSTIGLAIGMACFILIMLWVWDELSYDRFHKNSNRICRVIWDIDKFLIPATPGPLANWLKEYIPEIEQTTRVNHQSGVIQYEGKKISVEERFIDPYFFKIFSFQFIRGDSASALKDEGSILLTEDLAHKLFGNADPMGKIVFWENGKHACKVTGIIQNIPRLTQPYLRADCFVPFELLRRWKKPDDWYDPQDYKTYVLLHENTSAEIVTKKINAEFLKFLKKYDPESARNYRMKYILQPITRSHLYSDFKFDDKQGDIRYVILFSIIAGFILIIAILNYVNLATVSSLKRTSEVGLRKVVGANKWQILTQFLGESVIISSIASFLALILVESFLPYFNSLTDKPLEISYSNYYTIGCFIGFILITGILSGIYPALFLSSFKPINTLKDKSGSAKNSFSFWLRRILVVLQFIISIVIIIGTLLVYKQLDYIRNKKLGFEKENLVYVNTKEFILNYETLRSELIQNPHIVNVAASLELLTNIGVNNGAEWEGSDKNKEYISFPTLFVSPDFLETFKIRLDSGRFFSREFPGDQNDAFVINEAAVHAMGMKNPVGKRFKAGGKEGRIIGVIQNFNFRSLRNSIDPLILNLDNNFQILYLRINSTDQMEETMDFIKNVYKKNYPDHLFEIHFFQESLDNLYRSEQKLSKIFFFFSLLAIIISCMGLLGLVSFVVENKTKEIGIRKANGATILEIMLILSKDYILWIAIAFVIACPIAYYAMDKWLQDFAYKTTLSWWIFAIAGLLAFLIALVTVSWQSWRAASKNPVEALRYE